MIVIRFLLKALLAPVLLVMTAMTFLMGLVLAISTRVLALVSSLFMFLALLVFLDAATLSFLCGLVCLPLRQKEKTDR